MYEVSETFLEKLNSHEIQKIRGKIVTLADKEIILDDSNLLGSPRYEKQCIEDSESFMFGQLYTGTAEILLNEPNILRDELRGGTLTLEFGLEGLDEWIPLGVWIIDNPERDDQDHLIVRGSDCTSRLNVAISDNFVGAIGIEAGMLKVTELTGIEFAQTAEEVESMVNGWFFGTNYPTTCREEVVMISQLIGGFAFANRYGKIEFRKFGEKSVLDIPANDRFKAKLNEYTYGIRGVGYTDEYGQTGRYTWEKESDVNENATLIFSENRYIWDKHNSENPDETYSFWLKAIAENLQKIPDWVSGELQFYGNPCLDLGDIVTVQGGINGENSTNFLITFDYWKFRSPQTLISAGASENSVSSGGSYGTVSQSLINVNVSKTLNIVEFSVNTNDFTGNLQEVASLDFSVKTQTFCFVDMTANLTVSEQTLIKINILLDGIKQDVYAVESAENSEKTTMSFSVPLEIEQGKHTATVEISGNFTVNNLSAVLWGQNITAEKIEPKPDNYGQLIDRNIVQILDVEGTRIYVKGEENGG